MRTGRMADYRGLVESLEKDPGYGVEEYVGRGGLPGCGGPVGCGGVGIRPGRGRGVVVAAEGGQHPENAEQEEGVEQDKHQV